MKRFNVKAIKKLGVKLLPLCFFAFAFISCRSTEKATEQKIISSADYPYMERFHEGVRQKSRGQVNEAIKTFESCLLVKPNDDAVIYALAQCHLILDEKQKAAIYTEKAAKLDPHNIWYTQELAYMYFEQGKLNESVAYFKKLVEEQPKNVDWLFGYAEILKRTDKKEEALNNYSKMEDQLGILPDISIEKFNLYRAMKQDDKALECIVQARRLYPDEIALIGTLIDYYFEKQQFSKAKDMLLELVRTNPTNGKAHLALADLAMHEHRKSDAYVHFKQAFEGDGVDLTTKNSVLAAFSSQQVTIDPQVIELAELIHNQHPDDATSLSFLGDFNLRNGNKQQALGYFKQALQRNDTNYNTWNQVLMIEYQLYMFDSLYRDARACSALFPTLSNVQLLYAEAALAIDHKQEALDAIEIGIETVINDPALLSEFQAVKAEILYKMGKTDEGKKWFRKAFENDPNNKRAKINYAISLAKFKKEFNEAKLLINQTYPADKPADYYYAQAHIAFSENDLPTAKTAIDKAIEFDPIQPFYPELLGDIYIRQNLSNEALNAWNTSKNLGNSTPLLLKKITTRSYHAPY